MNLTQNISAKELLDIDKSIPIIDIRTASEWYSTGVVPNSHLLTFFDEYGRYDLNAWVKEFEKIVDSKEKKFILVCAHAVRTQNVGDYLASKLEYINTTQLEGGISTWFANGFEVTKVASGFPK